MTPKGPLDVSTNFGIDSDRALEGIQRKDEGPDGAMGLQGRSQWRPYKA